MADDTLQQMRAALGGSREAFGVIVVAEYRRVWAAAFAVTGNPTAADDVAQEAFLVAWRQRETLANPEAFGMWVRQIARNLARSWHRSANVRRKYAEARARAVHEAHVEPEAAQTVEDEERRRAVARAIERLSPRLREAVVLYYFEDQSVSATARILRTTETTIKSRLYQARHRMRLHFETMAAAGVADLLPPRTAQRRRGEVMGALLIGPALSQVGAEAARAAAKGLTGGAGALSGAGVFLKIATVAIIAALAVGGAGWWLNGLQQEAPIETPAAAVGAGPTGVATVPTGSTRMPDTSKTASRSALLEGNQRDPATAPAAERPKDSQINVMHGGIEGYVLDEDALPIPGATVLVLTTDWEALRESLFVGHMSEIMHSPVTATADANGYYFIEDLAFSSDVASMYAQATGYAANDLQDVRLVAGETVRADITLLEGFDVHGVLLDHGGHPVADAIVRVGGFISESISIGGGNLMQFTDGQGQFTLSFQREGVVVLHITSKVGATTTFNDFPVRRDAPPVELRLGEPGTVKGRVKRSDGSSAEGMVVLVRQPWDLAWLDAEGTHSSGTGGVVPVAAGLVTADGSYEVKSVPPGVLMAQVVEGREPRSTEEDIGQLEPGGTAVKNFVIGEGSTVYVRVVGAGTGDPVPGACVDYGREVTSTRAHPDRQGLIEVALQEPGSYRFQPSYAQVHGSDVNAYTGWSQTLDVADGELYELTLRLPDPVGASVRVVDSDGMPVEAARVGLVRRTGTGGTVGGGSPNAQPLFTDTDGYASWGGFPPGDPIWFSVTKDGWLPVQTESAIGESGKMLPEQTVVMYEQSGAEGRLVEAQGVPLAGVWVRVVLDNGYRTWERTDTTDAQGFFTSLGLPATTGTLTVRLEGWGETAPAEVTLPADGVLNLGELRVKRKAAGSEVSNL